MRRRVGVYGATEETLRLIPLLWANPGIEIAGVWDADPETALARAADVDAELAASLRSLVSDDFDAFVATPELAGVIDSGVEPGFASRVPDAAELGIQVLSPLTARLLWGYGVAVRDHKSELLNALSEVAESVELSAHSDDLFQRMLEIAVGATGADGGSLMLLDAETGILRIRVAVGVEPELWPKIQVRLGEGLAGRAAADLQSIAVRGKADPHAFRIIRERLDLASALCVPLVHESRVHGVLNLHHHTRSDAFSAQDLAFTEQLAALDARIVARAREHESLRDQAARYRAVRDLRAVLASRDPLPERLRTSCRFVSERLGQGIAHIYLNDPEEGGMTLAATSLEGGGFAGEYRVARGHGIDGRAAESGVPTFLRGERGFLAYAALPLHAGDQTLGVLSLQAGRDAPGGRAAEETLLEIAAAIAEAVAQSEREARFLTRATRVGAINEAGIRMLSSTDPSEVVRTATSSAAMIFEADHAVLRLHDEASRRYVIRSYFGAAEGRQQEELFRLDKRVCVAVIKRRRSMRVGDLAQDAAFSPLAGGIRSLLSAPLTRDGRVSGVLTLYDKVAVDRFYAGRFSEEDLQVFGRFMSYVERAVHSASLAPDAREHRNFDAETGLPNARYLGQRIQEELGRSAARAHTLAVAVCRIENLEELARRGNPAHAHRVMLRTADALRCHLRSFDVLGRTGDGEFGVLMPEPGDATGERVAALARSVADAIAKDESLSDPTPIALSFGYAVAPEDGSDREQLLHRASEPRIRTV